jgi:hypothetical protein
MLTILRNWNHEITRNTKKKLPIRVDSCNFVVTFFLFRGAPLTNKIKQF